MVSARLVSLVSYMGLRLACAEGGSALLMNIAVVLHAVFDLSAAIASRPVG